ncbi:MAG: capsid protein [Bacillota bacterium]|nr:capsid protein [Bacillota bacterium]
MVMKILNIQPAAVTTINILEPLSYEANVLRNRLWYRGEPSELDQFFKQSVVDMVSRSRFWAAVPSAKLNIRKMHSGLPSIIADTLAKIVVKDLNTINFDKQDIEELWEEISEDNKFQKLLKKSIIETLVTGDGAFKITIDTDITEYPIIEYFGGENVDYTIQRGRIKEVIFYTDYNFKNKNYRLVETFGYGYIKNQLITDNGTEVPISTIPDTADLQDVSFKGNFMMAVPMKFYDSPKWDNRGKSIFDNKTDAFDGLDEVISQWIDAIRAGRVQKYIPEDLIPKDAGTGKLMEPNPFDNQFLKIGGSLQEDAKNEINIIQAQINYEAFIESYANALDMCLQGIISPSTLGIDLKKKDNAEAQREKEKTTLYTRGDIVDTLSEVLPMLLNTVLKANNTLAKKDPGDDEEISLDFGEYAAPDFENRVDTVGKAKLNGIMSIEQCVEQLYGDDWTDEEKAAEVERLKEEQGMIVADEPKVPDNPETNIEDSLGANLNG